MTAEYTTSLLYPGNPYVEALPPMLAGQELIRALASVPPSFNSLKLQYIKPPTV